MSEIEEIRQRRSAEDSSQTAAALDAKIVRNLNGQKMGRKGRITRERILAATIELLEGDTEEALTLSAVARGASLGLTSLYNYFSDLTELLLAVLEPVMDTSEEAYLAKLREFWPDEELAERCFDFVSAYHRFWAHHARLLHLRNSMADQHDERMILHRIESTRPVIALLVGQMEGPVADRPTPDSAMATMVMTGIERAITIATDQFLPKLIGTPFGGNEERFLMPGARLMEMAIRDKREQAAS
ncbi:MAG: TetR/AcrR family transcriptional regulator [Novosphingobium sp.]|nr:TetR/AcrR family transcriptional regulator [Novosphingobium sp.]